MPERSGNCMGYCKIRSIPVVEVQISYGIGMGLSHIIPIVDPMGYLWIAAKYVTIP